jgi:hypothetical protein
MLPKPTTAEQLAAPGLPQPGSKLLIYRDGIIVKDRQVSQRHKDRQVSQRHKIVKCHSGMSSTQPSRTAERLWEGGYGSPRIEWDLRHNSHMNQGSLKWSQHLRRASPLGGQEEAPRTRTEELLRFTHTLCYHITLYVKKVANADTGAAGPGQTSRMRTQLHDACRRELRRCQPTVACRGNTAESFDNHGNSRCAP